MMSHDITAYAIDDQVIAELSRGAFNPLNRKIYEVLDCVEDCYSGVSGTGESKNFTSEQIIDALLKIDRDENLQPEHDFLKAIALSKNDIVCITFW